MCYIIALRSTVTIAATLGAPEGGAHWTYTIPTVNPCQSQRCLTRYTRRHRSSSSVFRNGLAAHPLSVQLFPHPSQASGMELAFALLVVVWWIAIWGLFDIATEGWTREEKLRLYVAMLLFVVAMVTLFPKLTRRL